MAEQHEIEEPTWGIVNPAELARVVILSPHFDDAVMGAGHVISSHPGTHVVTVFASAPPSYPEVPSDWDALGGFGPGDDVAAERRKEDVAAMAVLGGTSVWLEFADHQYLAESERATAEQVAAVLVRTLEELQPSAVFAPMGLGNPDHVVTHDAALLVRAEHLDWSWFCYEDQGYKHVPGLLSWRVARLLKHGPWATPAMVPRTPEPERKRQAIWCYRSQIAPLERDHALTERMETHVPEQYWRLAAPPRGWEGLADLV
jgi:LmbE family N-acetylglucosaminyl deacetylase